MFDQESPNKPGPGSVGGTPYYPQLSPYLNIDPNVLRNTGSSYITPEGGAAMQRGRFELAFTHIGACVIGGGSIGGIGGAYKGWQSQRGTNLPMSVWRTQMFNHIAKTSAIAGQTLGIIGFLYGLTGFLVYKARGVEDNLNVIAAGTTAFALYRCPHGLLAAAKGGGGGLALAGIYTGYNWLRGQ